MILKINSTRGHTGSLLVIIILGVHGLFVRINLSGQIVQEPVVRYFISGQIVPQAI